MRFSKLTTGILFAGTVALVMASAVWATTGPVFIERFDGYADLAAMQSTGGWLIGETVTDESLATDRYVSAPKCYRNGLATTKDAKGRRYKVFVSPAGGLSPSVEPVVWKFWIYDNNNRSGKMSCDLIADGGSIVWPPGAGEDAWFSAGWYNSTNPSLYQIRTVNGGGTVGTAYYPTTVTRTQGWHEFRIVISPTTLTLTIDGNTASALTLSGGAWGGKKFNMVCVGMLGTGTSTAFGADFDNIQVSYQSDENAICGLVNGVAVSTDIPLMDNDSVVTVKNVDPLATKVSVYANGLEVGNNPAPGGQSTVDVTLTSPNVLHQDQTVVATQWKDVDVGGGTIQNVESCLPTVGPVVGHCSQVGALTVQPPVYTGVTTVNVSGVAANASVVTVYRYDAAGPTWTPVASNTSPTAGTTSVDVSGASPSLSTGEVIVATQTIPGRMAPAELEGCKPTSGLIVDNCNQLGNVTVKGAVWAGSTRVWVSGIQSVCDLVKVYQSADGTTYSEIGSASTGGAAQVGVDLSTALEQGYRVRAIQFKTGTGMQSCESTAPVRYVNGSGVTPEGAAYWVLEDFQHGLTSDIGAYANGHVGQDRTWYEIKSDAYSTVTRTTTSPPMGSAQMDLHDPGFTNGMYAVYEKVLKTGEYHLQVDMWVNEPEGSNTDAIRRYQVGAVAGGWYRSGGSLPAITKGPTSGVGDYVGLTGGKDGYGVDPTYQTVYMSAFDAVEDQDLQIAFSTHVDDDLHTSSTTWSGSPYMMVDNIRLVEGPPPCLPSAVGAVNVVAASDTVLLEANSTQVKVTNLATGTSAATKVSVYEYTPPPAEAWRLIGENTSPAGQDAVLVNTEPLVAHKTIVATQWLIPATCDPPPTEPMEGVKPKTGPVVGTKKNSPLKLALGVREVAVPGTGCNVGDNGGITGAIEWVGVTAAGSPPQGKFTLSPSYEWQTVTFDPSIASEIKSFNAGDNILNGACYVLEHLALAATGGNGGAYTVYIDNITLGDGATVIDFEDGTEGAVYMFRAPNQSGTTSGNLLNPPAIAEVSSEEYDGATPGKSLKVKFQFRDEATSRWLRLTTDPTGLTTAQPLASPIMSIAQPITMRILLEGGTCRDPFADVDGDGDVDQADFAAFQACLSGSGVAYVPGCDCFDRESDNDVDSDDAGAFEACASGPGIAANPACDGD